jgi:hypothetical protein
MARGFKPKPPSEAEPVRVGRLTSLPVLSGTGRPGVLPTTQINIRLSVEMATVFCRLAEDAGSSRRALAKLLADAGHPVPSADQNSKLAPRRFVNEPKRKDLAARRREAD